MNSGVDIQLPLPEDDPWGALLRGGRALFKWYVRAVYGPNNPVLKMAPPPDKMTTEEKRRFLADYTDTFEKAIRVKILSWRICARQLGGIYSDAAKMHKDTLDKADKSSTALDLAAMWSAVSVLATGGVSFAFGKDLATTGASVAKDMSTAVTSAAGNVGPPISAFFMDDPPNGLVLEPEKYKDGLLTWIDKFEQTINQQLVESKIMTSHFTDAEWEQYDVGRRRFELAYALAAARPLAGMKEVTAPERKKMTETLEKRFWAEWILSVCSKKNEYQAVPVAVAHRLDQLKILEEAGTTINSFWHTLGDIPVIGPVIQITGHTRKQEDQKLYAWANKFKANFDKSDWGKMIAAAAAAE
jgi:hypothetical protein